MPTRDWKKEVVEKLVSFFISKKWGGNKWVNHGTALQEIHKWGKLHLWTGRVASRTAPRISSPGNLKSLGSGGSLIARLKLKGIDGRAPQDWILRLNLTQRWETHQVRKMAGLTDWQLFLDSSERGAWPFLVGGVICLVNSDNERDLGLQFMSGSFCC